MQPDIHLGLGPSPRPEYLYVSTDHSPSGWHRWNHAKNEPIIVDEPAVTGYVTKAERVEKEYQGKATPKLCLHVSAGPRTYVVQSGLDTQFSHGVLAALARLEPSHFDHALTIEVQPGDTGKVVFGNLYNAANGRRVRHADTDQDESAENLLARVQATLAERTNGSGQ